MLNCRQVTRLVSQSMDARLSWPQRLAVRFNLLYCVWCRRYAKQIRFLRKAAGALAGAPDQTGDTKLSPEAKEQIRQKLAQAARENGTQ